MPRATVYRRLDAALRQARKDEEDLELRALIDEEYTHRPLYGSRRMVVFWRGRGWRINRKRVQRLMREMSLAGMARGRRRVSTTRSTRFIPICCAAWR